MGVKLRSLVDSKKIGIEDLSGRIIAFDGHNVLYQFLSIIRGRMGEPLKDKDGKITSHLSGLISRNSNFIEAGLRLAYVFDGKPHQFKKRVVSERKELRRKAQLEYEQAKKEGRLEEARRHAQRAVVITDSIISDAKRLLNLIGVPWIQSPGEGEAQSAYMVEKGDVWASASQDFDSLMYGAPKLIRNLSITGRRKLPRKNVYIKIEPEIIELSDLLSKLDITHSQLIDIGLLVGTDYNPKGVVGVGPKTALKLIKKYSTLEKALMNIENAEFPYPIEEIKELFANPRTTNEYILEWRRPDSKGIVDFLCGERDFNRERVNKSIEKLEKGFDKWRKRVSLDFWFD